LQTKQDTIGSFLKFYPSKGTKKSYKSVLNKFFRTLGCSPNSYFSSGRDYEADLYDFALSIRRMANKTFHSYIVIIKTFFLENDITVSEKTLKRIKRLKPGTYALTRDRLPTIDELKLILSHADLRMKALILTLLSSGMRIGEAVRIKINDVDFENSPTRINLRSNITKTKKPRIVFISDEATIYVKEFLRHHDSYMRSACNRLNIPGKTKNLEDDRVFPFNESSVNSAFQRLLRLSNLDQRDTETNLHIIHIHCFRKAFRTKMALEIPLDIVETLLGHSGYLSSAYVRHSEQELASYYLQGMNAVTVFGGSSAKEIKALEEEIKRRDKKIEQIESKVGKFGKLEEAFEELAKSLKGHEKALEMGFGKALINKKK